MPETKKVVLTCAQPHPTRPGKIADAGAELKLMPGQANSLVLSGRARFAEDKGAQRPGIGQILADVGEDKDKARTALAAELEGNNARSSLVKKLEKIANSEEN